MEKQKYSEPEIEVIFLDTDDVIATSGGGGGIVLPDDKW